jgi:hypothetical protein
VAQPLDSLLLRPSTLASAGIQDSEVLDRMRFSHPDNAEAWRRIEMFFADPLTNNHRHGLTLEQASEHMYTMDVQNSYNPLTKKEQWMRLSALGHSPTVTASHNSKSIALLHKDHMRFLLPHEHAIIQGWSMKHVAVAHDLFSNNTKTIATLAGKGFHVDVIQNVILSIIRSYPERFYKGL